MGQSPLSAKDEKVILGVMHMQENAWNEGNIEKFMEGYWKSDQLVFVGRNGPTYGWDETLSNYKKSYPNREAMGTLAFTILKLEKIDRTTARMIGRFELQRKNDQPSGYFTLLWKKIEGNWLIIGDHTSGD